MTVVCPEGHDSEATDYCDVCGSPIEASVGVTAPAPAAPAPPAEVPAEPSAAPTQRCPHCGASNHADALFCESCGYDFTTGAAPFDAPAEEAGEAGDVPAPGADAKKGGEADADGAGSDLATDPAEDTEPDPAPVAPATAQPSPAAAPPEAQPGSEPAAPVEPEADVPQPATATAPSGDRRPTARQAPPSRALADAWVVELWVDPDWYAVQQTAEACPSPGLPEIVRLSRTTALIGRPSSSLGARPEIDAGMDSAVSRRHAQLTSDGRRWWVEDLGSSNGTFVGTVGEPLPTTPLSPGQRVEIDRDSRVYVGAWTRLVVRPAVDGDPD